MRDDAGSGLGLLGSFKQCASPSIRLTDLSHDGKAGAAMAPSRWLTLWQQQPKYVSCVALVLGLTLLFSTVLVNEQTHTGSFLDRVATSFKAEGLPVQATEGKCRNLSTANTARNFTPGLTRTEACYAQVAEALPRGIIVPTTDLQMRSLADEDEAQVQKAMTKNLLAMAVGIKQKQVVDGIVQKFPLSNFTIMLFHYDGFVDQWHDLAWSNQTIHVVALHQTKWWFAKRFMHPDIVAQYNYIFLWDEDLGVENFHADRYLDIMQSEGLEISQPALDPLSLEIHHRITRRHPRLIAHKAIFNKGCPAENKAIPCTGYVEVMAPVFTKAAWKCVWHMIQNDLVHGWGIDFKLGHCAQGLRSEKVGVIDAEYILHKGIPSLGSDANQNKVFDRRQEVRRKSGEEMTAFQERWSQAASEDSTWVDPYREYAAAERSRTIYRAGHSSAGRP